MSDLNEIRNRITDLMYGTTVPQGQVWKAIHEIEAQYQDEIEKLEQDRDAAVAANHSVRVCAKHTTDITNGEGCLVCDLQELRGEISAMQNHIDHHLEVIESLLSKNERLHDENSQLRSEKKA